MNILDILLRVSLFIMGIAIGYITREIKYKRLYLDDMELYPYRKCDQDCEVCTNKCEIYELMKN